MRRLPDTGMALLTLTVSALLHAGLLAMWLQHQYAMTGATATQEITVDLFSADTAPAVAPAPPAETPAPSAIPAPTPKPAPSIARKTPAQPVALATRHPADNQPIASQQPTTDTHPAPQPTLIPAQHDAAYLHNPHPEYPSIARRMNEQGLVLLQVEVSADGLPVQIAIKQSSGFARLDDSARKTVMHWRFVPAKLGNEAVASTVDVPIQFSLQK